MSNEARDVGYCPKCGHKLIEKYLEKEGDIPFCEACNEFRFRMFNVAISAIVYDPDREHIILIQQYGRKWNILVAGYVTLGESVEHTLKREIKEELGLDVVDWRFNASEHYGPTNTLMVNFACVVNSNELTHTNDEIDYIQWYTPEEAKENILKDSLAKKFLLKWLSSEEKNLLLKK